MMCLVALSVCVVSGCSRDDVEETSGNYVDLGLPSGTKWKAINEVNAADAKYDFFTYDEAMAQFGDNLPSKEQWEELINECKWTWTGSGYKVVGPNGKRISLPAAGFREDGRVCYVGSAGYYWSSTNDVSYFAWHIEFNETYVNMYAYDWRYCFSVRLVEN